MTPIAFIPVPTTQSVNFFDPTRLDGFGNPTLRSVNMPFLSYQISFPGGDTSGVFNAEYRIPIVGPVSMSLFTDAGTAGNLRPSQLQLNSAALTSLQTQFQNPQTPLSNSLRLDPGTNFKFRGSAGIEFVVHLPIIQAPFRLYWSYNYDRLSQQIVAPMGSFGGNCPTATPISSCTTLNNLISEYGSTFVNSTIQPQLNSILNNPQRINFFEQKTTLRFTVSRTF